MSGPTSLWFVVWVCFLVRVSGGETDVEAKPGRSVVLPCEAEKNVEHVEWRRGNETVCTCSNDNRKCNSPPQQFENRVQLNNTLTSGDLSLILTNVKETDAGKYKCSVKLSGGNRRKRNVGLKLRNTVNLKIERGETTITVKPGESVVLPCEAEKNVEHVEWRRGNDLVCVCDNGNRKCDSPPQQFENRVQLNNALTSGDASLILKNVNETDAGKYECYVQLSGGKRRKRNDELKLRNTINLKIRGGVKKEGDASGGANAGHAGPVAAVIVPLLVVVVAAAVGGFFYRNRGRRSGLSNNQPDAQQPLQKT